VIEGESGKQVEGESESMTSSTEWFVQRWRNEAGSWFQRWGCEMTDLWFSEK